MTVPRAKGRSIAIIGPSGTMASLGTGCPSPFHYRSMMASAYMTDMHRRYLDDLARAGPDDVSLVRPEVDDSLIIVMWWAVHAWLEREYTFEPTTGSFDL